jgi:Ca2+-binding EF-hand superfamily protein
VNRVIPFALGALLASSASAQAPQQRAYDPHQAFVESDKNKDGFIEMSEFVERINDVYFLGDTNKDGKLSKDEYDAIVVIREDYTIVDKNGDGVISESEFVAARVPLFEKADTDKDGKLSEQEIKAAYEAKKK